MSWFLFGASEVVIPKEKNIIYSRTGCKHCARAKHLLAEKGIAFEDRSVNEKQYAKELITLMKKQGVAKMAIMVPQIWLQGEYIGGADELEVYFKEK